MTWKIDYTISIIMYFVLQHLRVFLRMNAASERTAKNFHPFTAFAFNNSL